MPQIFTATASNGQTITRKSGRTFAFCIVYVGSRGYTSPAWAADAAKAEKVAAGKRRIAATPQTSVAGMAVEILPARAV